MGQTRINRARLTITRQPDSRTPHLVEKDVSFVHPSLGSVQGAYLISVLHYRNVKQESHEQDILENCSTPQQLFQYICCCCTDAKIAALSSPICFNCCGCCLLRLFLYPSCVELCPTWHIVSTHKIMALLPVFVLQFNKPRLGSKFLVIGGLFRLICTVCSNVHEVHLDLGLSCHRGANIYYVYEGDAQNKPEQEPIRKVTQNTLQCGC